MTYEDLTPLEHATADRYGIPAWLRVKWQQQRGAARQRGIVFDFPLLRWSLWWRTELAKAGPGARRGCRRGEYVMARVGDAGAYEAGNVYLSTVEANSSAAHLGKRHGPGSRTGAHLATRGYHHPRSRAILTPLGRFGSAALAAEAAGITRQAAARRARERRDGWRYEWQPEAASVQLAG